MAIPWLGVIDTLLDLTSLALTRKSKRTADETALSTTSAGPIGQLETRLAGVVVAALKEAFDRDAKRLELEREQLERERARADRLLKIDLLRQAGEREIGRLRLLAGLAVASWVGTLLFMTRLIEGATRGRVMLGVGWALLLVALALSFAAQGRIGRSFATIDLPTTRPEDLSAGTVGGLVPWLIIVGLAMSGFAVLIG
jgi:hypothetical protein